ncbi:MAG: DUF5685 family protein [Lachnospiraceae bacterium]|nr:DUF5685 family protein [Lachnospiraceae bacterium]
MLGYITVNTDELKGKDQRKYKEFYCGVCRDIKKRSGQFPRAFLTYDMTFLAILLSSLNETEEEQEEKRCSLHPFRKTAGIHNKWTAYAADMNVLLTYYNLLDDWSDEKKLNSRAAAGMMSRSSRKIMAEYPKQTKALESYLEELHKVEAKGSDDLDLASGLTGRFFGELFCEQEQAWKEELQALGFYLGKWIYLMDARLDVEKDSKSGNYNPFLSMYGKPDFEDRSYGILMMMAAEAAKAFERLPIVENVDILRNILYSGIWNTYRKNCNSEEKKSEE